MKEKNSSSLSIFRTDWKNYQCTTGNKQNHTALSDTILKFQYINVFAIKKTASYLKKLNGAYIEKSQKG